LAPHLNKHQTIIINILRELIIHPSGHHN